MPAARRIVGGPAGGFRFSDGGAMRRVVTGTGADGRSTVLSDGAPPAIFRFAGRRGAADPHTLTGSAPAGGTSCAADGEVVVAELWMTGDPPGADATDPTVGAGAYDVEAPAGGTKWRLVEMGPHRVAPMHRTATIDYDVVLAGEIDLLLEAGEVRLRTGDAVVLPGIVHGWRTGAAGCRMSVAMVSLAGGGRGEGGTRE